MMLRNTKFGRTPSFNKYIYKYLRDQKRQTNNFGENTTQRVCFVPATDRFMSTAAGQTNFNVLKLIFDALGH